MSGCSYTFGLRHEESYAAHREAEAAEDEVGSISMCSDIDEHYRRGTSDSEIEDPLRACGHGDIHSSKTIRGYFGDIYPAHRAPSKLKRCGKQIDKHQGASSCVRDGLALDWRIESDVKPKVEHAEPHEEGGPDEGPSPTKVIREKCDEDGAGGELYDAVHTGCEKTVLIAGDTEISEDGGRVVVDCVGLIVRQ